jgi:hypothetical protein
MLVLLIMFAVYADYSGWLPGRTIYAGILGVTLLNWLAILAL